MSAKTIGTWIPGYPTQDQVDLINTKMQTYVANGWTDGIPSIDPRPEGNIVTRTWDNLEHAQDYKNWSDSLFAGVSTIIATEV